METNPRSLSMLRAADAMLHALGGAAVVLRLPGAPLAADPRAGLATASTEDIALAPAVVRALPEQDGRARFELLVSATALRELAAHRGLASVDELLASVVAVVGERGLLRIARVDTDIFGGVAYLYRLLVFHYPEVTA